MAAKEDRERERRERDRHRREKEEPTDQPSTSASNFISIVYFFVLIISEF